MRDECIDVSYSHTVTCTNECFWNPLLPLPGGNCIMLRAMKRGKGLNPDTPYPAELVKRQNFEGSFVFYNSEDSILHIAGYLL
jgi:hypothetical protein